MQLPPKGRTCCQKMVINWDLDNLSGDQTSTGKQRYCKCTIQQWIWPLARLNSTLPCAHWILWILHKPAYPGQSHSNNFTIAAVNSLGVSFEMLSCCLSHYYCIVNTRVIIAFINTSLYSCAMYRQVKEMVTLHLFIESPLQIHCIKYQRKAHPYSSLVHS